MPSTDGPRRLQGLADTSAPSHTVRLGGLHLLSDAETALRGAVEELHRAGAHFTGSAHALGHEMGDPRLASRYEPAFRHTQQTITSLQSCYSRLVRGLSAVRDAYAETDPAAPPAP